MRIRRKRLQKLGSAKKAKAKADAETAKVRLRKEGDSKSKMPAAFDIRDVAPKMRTRHQEVISHQTARREGTFRRKTEYRSSCSKANTLLERSTYSARYEETKLI
jgi:hypothetical protein